MAEYLAPGVYVEEFDSEPSPMQGTPTSITGFIGLAAQGPVGGPPQLVASWADFENKYGGYLSEREFGNYRYLAYAVEHFFANGGTCAYISRVAPSGAMDDAKTMAETFIGKDDGPGKRTGIQAFLDNPVCQIMAVPGITDVSVQLALVSHCETLKSRFAILDMPKEATRTDALIAHRNCFDSSYAALYHPWLTVFDLQERKNVFAPPSGAVAGIYARTDNTRGVHKAPANEVVRGCTGLSIVYNIAEQEALNPRGINLIRAFPGQGIRVWGARTASSNPSWKYVNIRRLFIYIEESIKANTNWVVFEPNDKNLWMRVNRTAEVFLQECWRAGALAGTSQNEAFFVEVGRTTMTQDDMDNGRLVITVGVAPTKPAEFVIFRITQKTAVE